MEGGLFLLALVGIVGAPIALTLAIRRHHAPWGALAFGALAVGSLWYLNGLFESDLGGFEAADALCEDRPMALPSTDYTLFPLSKVCLYADGTRTELTPPGTNLGVFISAATFAVFWFMSFRAARIREFGAGHDGRNDIEAPPDRRG